jgi:hypothetical protein
MIRAASIAAALLALLAVPAFADRTVVLPVSADNSIVLYPGEEHLNAGSAPRIRIKGNQHLVAMQFDVREIRGQVVKSAVLCCTRGEREIAGVTLSTIQAPWDETKSNALTSGVQKHRGWGWEGARFPAVTGGNSFSRTGHAKSAERDGVYRWVVPPDLVHALAVGAAHGIAIHEWESDYSRNPTIWSREAAERRRPRLEVTLGGKAPTPAPVAKPELRDAGDPESLRLLVTAPKTGFVYEVRVNGKPLPPWNTPYVRPRERQEIPIRDVGLEPGERVRVSVVTVSRTGKKSSAVIVRGVVPDPAPIAWPKFERLPRAGGTAAGLTVLPIADKLDAKGRWVGDLSDQHRRHNAVFDGKTVRLRAARGEVVSFLVYMTGGGRIDPNLELDGLRTELRRALFVTAGGRRIPDPLVPVEAFDAAPATPVVLCADVIVPFDEKRREVVGKLTIGDGRRLPVEISVRRFALPRRVSFVMEMNSYGVPDTVREYARLQEIAYDHRAHVNILHYSHQTAAPGSRKSHLDMRMANGRRMNERRYNAIEPGDRKGHWDDFATVFGPFLTGDHFARGHRGPVPLPGFYLTFHESWPLPVRGFFDGNPDAYEAFREHPEYAGTFVAVLADFLARARREGWKDAGLQVYLNNKGSLNDAKRAPWILDEPTSWYDFRALAFYADLVKRAKGSAADAPVRYRIDISRPQFDRGELRGKADLWVVNTASFAAYPRLLADRREFTGEEMWVYGSSNRVEEPNRKLLDWAVRAFRNGATGLVPWQTIDRTGKALTTGDPLALFIFDRPRDGRPVIHPSIRLKVYRRAQQDIEYLVLLREKQGLTPGRLSEFIDQYLRPGVPNRPDSFRRLREAAAVLIE